ncbi:MAG TPA: lipocalin family protein [Pedobacter sp.]
MKTLFISCFVSICLFISCEKTDSIPSNSLTGKWQLVGSYYSIGGPLIYEEADRETKSYISFSKDGGLQWEGSGYSNYKLKDSTTLTLIKGDQTEFDYFYKITGGKLELSPRTAMCIEGCSSVYKKVEE